MPEGRPTTPQADENEVFFDHLNQIKQGNLETVMTGEAVIDGGGQNVRPAPEIPSMEEFKEELAINEEIKAEQEQAWTTWRENRAFQLLGYGAIAYIAYSMILK